MSILKGAQIVLEVVTQKFVSECDIDFEQENAELLALMVLGNHPLYTSEKLVDTKLSISVMNHLMKIGGKNIFIPYTEGAADAVVCNVVCAAAFGLEIPWHICEYLMLSHIIRNVMDSKSGVAKIILDGATNELINRMEVSRDEYLPAA